MRARTQSMDPPGTVDGGTVETVVRLTLLLYRLRDALQGGQVTFAAARAGDAAAVGQSEERLSTLTARRYSAERLRTQLAALLRLPQCGRFLFVLGELRQLAEAFCGRVTAEGTGWQTSQCEDAIGTLCRIYRELHEGATGGATGRPAAVPASV